MAKLITCHHHGFTVSDLDASLRFYGDALGLSVVRLSERRNLPSYDQILGYDNVELKVALLKHPSEPVLLELFEYVNPPAARRELKNHYVGSSHLAFEVDNLDAFYAKLKAAGYGAIHEPIDVVRDGRCVARGVYVLDPDGISVELFQECTDVINE